jgi:hypothetical protein
VDEGEQNILRLSGKSVKKSVCDGPDVRAGADGAQTVCSTSKKIRTISVLLVALLFGNCLRSAHTCAVVKEVGRTIEWSTTNGFDSELFCSFYDTIRIEATCKFHWQIYCATLPGLGAKNCLFMIFFGF